MDHEGSRCQAEVARWVPNHGVQAWMRKEAPPYDAACALARTNVRGRWRCDGNFCDPYHPWNLAPRRTYLPLVEEHHDDKDKHPLPTSLCNSKQNFMVRASGFAISSYGQCIQNDTTTNKETTIKRRDTHAFEFSPTDAHGVAKTSTNALVPLPTLQSNFEPDKDSLP